MKPIGTITKFYPFLEDDSVSEIDSVVATSSDYHDFIRNLAKLVLSKEVQPQTAYFTAIQAHIAFGYDDEVWELVLPICREYTVLKPWFYWNNQEVAPWDQDQNELKQSVKSALEESSEDWVLLHQYVIAAWLSPEMVETLLYLDQAKQLLDNSPDLQPFAPYVYMVESWFEDDDERLLSLYERMLETATDFSDTYWIAESIKLKALKIKDSKPDEALTLLEESFKLFRTLGNYAKASSVAGDMGVVFTILGEYDAALEFILEEVDLSRKSLMPGKFRSSGIVAVISGVFCDLGQPDQALEWIKWYSESLDGTPWTPIAIIELRTARALIQLGKIDDGTMHLDRYYQQALESGSDFHLAAHSYVLGLRELQQKNIDIAISTLEQSLKEAERLGSTNLINRCLIALCKAEIASKSSGHWLDRLQEHAKNRKYNGIRMQHALLKAEYHIKMGENDEAQLVLKDALSFTDSHGVKTLRNRILEKLDELSR